MCSQRVGVLHPRAVYLARSPSLRSRIPEALLVEQNSGQRPNLDKRLNRKSEEEEAVCFTPTIFGFVSRFGSRK